MSQNRGLNYQRGGILKKGEVNFERGAPTPLWAGTYHDQSSKCNEQARE